MKLFHITGIAGAAVAALALAACGTSRYAAAERAEDHAEDERREAREAHADAERAREESARAQAEAQQALAAQREADRQAEIANQRAVVAEKQASLQPPYRGAAPRAGVTEAQPRGAVLFASGSAELSPDARARLDDIAGSLRGRGHARAVVIEGYTDDTGSESENADVSQRRADAVASYLVNRGVPAERITTRGLGSTNPASREDSDRGRALNRRVEILIQP